MPIGDAIRRLFSVFQPGASGSRPDDYVHAGGGGLGVYGGAVGDASVGGSSVPGYSAPEASSIDLYRRMRGCPTIALARMAASTPVKATPWTVDHDAGADAGMIDAAQEIIDLHRKAIVRHAATAMDYGYAAFEIVWDVVDGSIVPVEFVPQLPEQSVALVEGKGSRELAGAEFDKRRVPRAKTLWITHDSEACGFYGRSRGENVRGVYAAWNDTLSRLGRYTSKTAGVVPMVEYPEGKSHDRSGAEVDNFQIAEKVLAALGAGKGVSMPNSLVAWADEAIRRGVDITKLKAWTISFLESASGHGAEYVGAMRYFDSLLMRGWLVPERAATEGQSGTKAEAETHGDLAIATGEEFAGDIVDAVNELVIRPMLRMNLGPEAERSVILVASPVDRAAKAWLRQLMLTVFGSPANLGLLVDMVALDAAMDATGVPRRDGSDQDSVRRLLDPAEEPEGFAASMRRALGLEPGGK